MKKILTLILAVILTLLVGCVKVHIEKETVSPTEVTESTEITETTVPATEAVATFDDSKPLIALTFDDGPSANTEKMLDVLKKHNVKGTFFVVGNRIEGSEKTLKRMVKEGHDVGGHSWSHTSLADLKKKDITYQLTKTNDTIFDVTGYKSKIMRPPYGAWNDKVKKVAKKADLALINWNVDTEDWKSKNKKKIAKMIMKDARDGCIVLSHDLYDSTVEAMDIVIPKLKKKGYEIVTVTELLESRGGKIKAGEVYYNRWQAE